MVKLETMKYVFKGIPVERFKWVLTCNDPTWDNNRACGHVYGSLVEDKGRCYISISALASGNSLRVIIAPLILAIVLSS